jgi:hypothetical protein
MERITRTFWHCNSESDAERMVCRLFYVVKGPAGAVSYCIDFIGKDKEEHDLMQNARALSTAISWHGYQPHEDADLYGGELDDCDWLDGGKCYNRGHGYTIADETMNALKRGDMETMWSLLEGWYLAEFGPQEAMDLS